MNDMTELSLHETEDQIYSYRVAMFEELGFTNEDATSLAEATKVECRETELRKYEHDVPIYWGDVAAMLEAGATHDQVLRILL